VGVVITLIEVEGEGTGLNNMLIPYWSWC